MSKNTESPDSKMGARDRSRILKILEGNWQAETRGFHTYDSLALRETDPSRRGGHGVWVRPRGCLGSTV